jgi:hypothetical protein
VRCKSGDGCRRDTVRGRRFCGEHAATLDRVRVELAAESRSRRGKARTPRCLREGCERPRHPHSVLCGRHLRIEDAPAPSPPAKPRHARAALAQTLAGLVTEALEIDRDSSTATRALKLAVDQGLLGRAGTLYAPAPQEPQEPSETT